MKDQTDDEGSDVSEEQNKSNGEVEKSQEDIVNETHLENTFETTDKNKTSDHLDQTDTSIKPSIIQHKEIDSQLNLSFNLDYEEQRAKDRALYEFPIDKL